MPLSWQALNGDVHPAYYDAEGVEWLRTAVGGLLMTCGLTQVGSPCEDQGTKLGLHGRVHHLAAHHVAAEGCWVGDSYEMRVSGTVDEAAIFGESLRLSREIRSRLGENRIGICDTVQNLGFDPAPHMLLYHFNFGFPLLTEETLVEIPSKIVDPRESGTPVEGYEKWQAPTSGYHERVYYHGDFADAEKPTVVIRNPHFPVAGNGKLEQRVALRLTWSSRQLPHLVQWKMPGAGVHVLGIEPSNCRVEGRAAERRRGTLASLEPGESRTYELALEVDFY